MAPGKRTTSGGKPTPHLAAATRLWEQHCYDEAIRRFNEAVRKAPNDINVLLAAGKALGQRYHVERGLGLLERALRLAPRRADVQQAVGEVCASLGHMQKAEACFRRAVLLAGAPGSQFELAKVLERRHALEEAADLIDKVLRREPHAAPALLLRARIERRRGHLDRSIATLRQLTRGVRQPPPLLAEAYGELCLALDAAGEYDAAWEAILECKGIQLAHDAAAWNAAQFVLARCQQMVNSLTPDDFARWQARPAASPQRLALLTGFPRAGTTLLEQILDAHPQIVASEEKEVFSADIFPQLGKRRSPDAPIVELLDSLTDEQIAEARTAYRSAMEGMLCESIGERLHIDKNPAMNLMIPVMRRVFPELKLIIALRDPRDVIASCFLRYLPINPVSVCFLTLERTVDRFCLDMGAWLKMREMIVDWIEVRYEETVSDLRHEAKRVLAALSVPWDDSILAYRERAVRKPVRSPSYEEIAKPVFTSSVGRWQNYEKYLAPFLPKLEPLITSLGYATA